VPYGSATLALDLLSGYGDALLMENGFP